MKRYRYTAIDRAGVLRHGEMEASDGYAVVARLQRDGSLPLRTAGAGAGLARLWPVGRAAALRPQQVAEFTRELAIMLAAGQDLDRALRFLVETAPAPRVGRVVAEIREAVRDGATLEAALARHPASFSRLYLGLVHAGEAGGRLAEALERLAVMLERQRALAATVQSALIYPALLAAAATGSIVVMLTVVLPQFVPLFEQNGARLPPAAAFLLAAGDLVANDGLAALFVVLLVLIGIRLALRHPAIRLAADHLILRLPIAGTLLREVLAARLGRALGTLLASGTSLIAALAVVRTVLINRAAVAAIDAATASARDGTGLADALAAAGVFPARLCHLLRLGEENAQLATLALRAADIHEERVRLLGQRLLTLLVPAITLLMGLVVAAIVATLLQAMLSLDDLAQ